jgi:hypothetical protein
VNNKDVYLNTGSRHKDVWIGIDTAKKELTFSMSGGGIGYAKAMMDTTEHWGEKPTFIPGKGAIIVYSDHNFIIRDGKQVEVPGIKIGDGLAYLIDLPFVGDDLMDILENHISNNEIHVSQEEKDFWNSKLNCNCRDEVLLFTRN